MSERAMLIGEINQHARYMSKAEIEATGLSSHIIHELRSGTLDHFTDHELVVILERLAGTPRAAAYVHRHA